MHVVTGEYNVCGDRNRYVLTGRNHTSVQAAFITVVTAVMGTTIHPLPGNHGDASWSILVTSQHVSPFSLTVSMGVFIRGVRG